MEPNKQFPNADLAKYVDHTVLKPETSREKIKQFCEEAKEYHFAGCCFNPCHIAYAKKLLEGSDVKLACVIGFPLGATTTAVKAYEAKEALGNGADELDMVINIGMAKEHNWDYVREDIKAVLDVAHTAEWHKTVKVILETCLLTDEEKVKVCEICRDLGTDFVKTSTGMSTGGATVEYVALMKKTVGDGIEVKASTGIKTTQDLKNMVAAGATRMGTSSGPKIVRGEV